MTKLINRLEISKLDLQKTVDNQAKFAFPEFITRLRHALGITKKVMSEDLHIHHLKLFYLEHGQLTKHPEPDLLFDLADYFGVPFDLLLNKAADYINEVKKNEFLRKQERKQKIKEKLK
jgi:transcriptional regulator with XRE-family HTH domain